MKHHNTLSLRVPLAVLMAMALPLLDGAASPIDADSLEQDVRWNGYSPKAGKTGTPLGHPYWELPDWLIQGKPRRPSASVLPRGIIFSRTPRYCPPARSGRSNCGRRRFIEARIKE